MEGEGAGEHFGEHGEGSGHVVWTSAMSTYMLTDLDHKFDAEFLNKPLEHYKEMFTIFENSMATGKFAKGSSEPLGTTDVKDENDDGDVHAAPSPTDDNGASSSAVRPNKRSRVVDNEEEGLVAAFKSNSEMLAKAIEKAAANDVPEDLLDKVQSIPGFDDTHKAYYYEHLVKNPRMGRKFPTLPLTYQITLLAKFVNETFPNY
ncbi:hypothetical protein QOZ80_8AG0639100 [Eleusine coracana subsp. coracana]|nr:hypothetical protein QOZ80_8AG0639100 [Eleusine coracana subsp. coracana]